ncbi:efflux RND transporter periplasmic adaptor subunit [Aliikangiella coralliicola]|uniref:Efflux RND transporter periplasmic adaptor subunit n=1 Tax=Aliikangiella coralliicola TaxID=2592383 RepID=A0A545UDP0_9GAMM|nr:efflux RND transporter periplasmic adaptor subunit [Aliikangiella coralliicola]TQV87586.1 efflux RND transporter periplasmic adaptor subunit [Aliikangiella coralliicola]
MQKAIVPIISLFFTSIALTSLAEPIQVEVFYPEQEIHKLSLELSGTVVAKQDAQLAPLEAGLVKNILVEAGDKVSAGQALLSLDDTLAKLRLAQAEANQISAQVQQQEAKRQYDEVVSLAKSKLVADSLLAERKASLASANAALSNSHAQVALQKEIVKRHTVTAPFDGVIAQRNVDLGEWISQQNQIFQLVSDKSLRLIVDLPQEHLKAISTSSDLMVLIIPDATPDQQYRLPLTNIVTVSEPVSRTLQVRIDLPEISLPETNSSESDLSENALPKNEQPNNQVLIPGMSARARFDLSNKDDKLTWIPRSALKRHPDGGNSVFTVNTNKIKRHKISLIKSESDRIAVTGLPNEPAVVVSGTELLKDNQTVTPVTVTGFNNRGKR